MSVYLLLAFFEYIIFPAIRDTADRKNPAVKGHKIFTDIILISMTRTTPEKVAIMDLVVKDFLLGSRKDLLG